LTGALRPSTRNCASPCNVRSCVSNRTGGAAPAFAPRYRGGKHLEHNVERCAATQPCIRGLITRFLILDSAPLFAPLQKPLFSAGASSGASGEVTCYILPHGNEMTTEGVQFKPASDHSLLLYFGRKVTLHAHHRIRRLLHLLESEPISGVRNLRPAYCSLLVVFDPLALRHRELTAILRGHLRRLDTVRLPDPRKLQIPTCYGGEFGPDLNEVARLHGMTPAQVIELHASVTYVVYFLGFVPGFAYLGVLPEALATPRLANPRRSTPPGSVGIADNQTGVYPFATPGGWRLIGRTPIRMFRPDRNNMSFLTIGDRVCFKPISVRRFKALMHS
jgi:inhibitor of KinA